MSERVDLPGEASESVGEWVNLRDDRGHVQASYNPALMLLIIKERGRKTLHDLRKLKTPPCQEHKLVLG